MNPHFQPQNSPPYPQANPHYPQQVQPGPNRYPDLPPIQNPQQNQPYSQYNPHVGGVPGYLPPNQYGNIQGGYIEDQNSEKGKLEDQMKELDDKLKSGDLGCYMWWSYVVLFVSIPTTLYLFGAYLFYPYASIASGLSGLFALWFVVQSYFVISASNNKSVFKAHVVCWMMRIYLVFAVLAEGFGIVALIDYVIHPRAFFAELNVVFFFFATVHLLIHIFVNTINAFKVKKILIERAEIDMKLVERFFNNNA